jgi:multidrug transporter EmrE-like cation transporter
VFMKNSVGLTRLWPTVVTGLLFLAGAAFQGLAMRKEDMSVAYIFVLGLESVLAFFFGAHFFGESITATRLGAVALITLGIVLLHQ